MRAHRVVVLAAVGMLLVAGGAAGVVSTPRALGAPKHRRGKDGQEQATQPLAWLSTADSDVVRNADGTLTQTTYAGPVNFQAGDGAWQKIDTRLVPEKAGDYGWAAAASPLAIEFAADASAKYLARFGDGATSVQVGYAGANKGTEPVVQGSTISYGEIESNTALVEQARRASVEQMIVLSKAPTGSVSYRLPLALNGLSAKITKDGEVNLVDPKGAVEYTIPQPQMWDSADDGGMTTPAASGDVKLSLEDGAEGPVLVLTPNKDWLADARRAYPVVIDPTFDRSPFVDTFVENDLTTRQDSLSELRSGTPDGGTTVARALVRFLVGGLSGKHILSGTLSMWENYSASCTASTVNVYEVTSTLTGSAVWSSQPTINPTSIDTKSVAKGFSGSCAAGDVDFDVTTAAADWASGTTNNGLEIRAANETDSNSWKKWDSAEGTTPPHLSVTYNSAPNVPTHVIPESGSWVKSLTPTLHGWYCDPDGGSGQVDFEVHDVSSGSLVASGSSGSAASCSDATWTVSSTLTAGTQYEWRARGDDGTDTSPWSSYATFQADSTKPSLPSVTSSTHPTQTTWYSSLSLSASWSATDADSGIRGYAYVLDQTPTTAPDELDGSGTSFSETLPQNGIYYLHVRAQDNAGNWGPTKHFEINVAAALLSPVEGARTQKYLTLQAQSDPALSGATFQYRRNATAGWTNVPSSDVQHLVGGTWTTITGWPVSLTAGGTEALRWNVTATTTVDGPIQLQAVFSSGSTPTTNMATVALDQTAFGASYGGSGLGPGSVNLVTGNYDVTETDVSVGGLSVSRSFESRSPTAGSTTSVLGPGWTSGLEVATYQSLREAGTSDGSFVDITGADGTQYQFVKDGSGYDPSPTVDPTWTLTKTGAGPYTFTLMEGPEGAETTFTLQSGASDYTVNSYAPGGATGTQNTTLYDYDVAGGIARPTKVIAPAAQGVTCTTTTYNTGCRELILTYATATTATGTTSATWGDFAGHLKNIKYKAYDPVTSSALTTTCETYKYDTNGSLRQATDARPSTPLKTRYDYDGNGDIATITPPGLNAWTLTYSSSDLGRLLSASRPGDPTGTETTTVAYNVPLSGSGAPYAMSSADVAQWGQTDVPTDATAVFPPTHVPSTPPANYTYATVYYVDQDGRQVNTAEPGGEITTTEYDALGNGWRTLSASNRAEALAYGSTTEDHQTRAAELDSHIDYDGSEHLPTDEWGPEHQVTLSSGDIVQARVHVHYTYDESEPSGGPHNLVTTRTEGARVSGTSTDTDVRTTKYSYSGQSNLGWALGEPTTVTTDGVSGGLNLVSTTLYDSGTGQVVETRTPAGPAGGDAHSTQSFYYTGDTSSPDASCRSQGKWAGWLCKTAPAAQPGTAGYPDLPVATFTYDYWGNQATETDTVGAASRVVADTYDADDRLSTESVTGPGTSLPAVTHAYDASDGLESTTTTSAGSIGRAYDNLGRLKTYTDVHGNVATYTYDLADRVSTLNDGKGTQTYTYDTSSEPRNILTAVSDSQAGMFTGSYDANGQLTSLSYPGGLTRSADVDETGNEVAISYTKTTSCTVGCVWFVDSAQVSPHGQVVGRGSSLSTQSYSYDQAGRLTWALDTVAGQCTTRNYGYDADSNRTAMAVRDPASDGSCQVTGAATTTTSTYDAGDRVTTSGYALDAMGRATSVPAADAGGAALTATYYADDTVNSLTQSGVTDTSALDPSRRVSGLATSISSASTSSYYYASDSDTPAWISENTAGSSWTRNVAAFGGLAAVADQSGSVVLQINDIRGDVVGTASSSSTAAGPTALFESDEFGNVRSGGVAVRYGWLGTYRRLRDPASGTLLMGARVYEPAVGRFLQPDPIPGASANAYDYVNQDPLDGLDLDGQMPVGCVRGACVAWQRLETWAHPRCHMTPSRFGPILHCGQPPTPPCSSILGCLDKITHLAITCLGAKQLVQDGAERGTIWVAIKAGSGMVLKATPVVGWAATAATCAYAIRTE